VRITVAARSKAWTVFVRSNAGIVGSNDTRDMDVCVRLFCVFVVLCVGSGLGTSWSPIQGDLPTVYRIKDLKKQQKSNKGLHSHIYIYIYKGMGAHGSLVGWGTMPQAGRSRARFPMRLLDFFNSPNPYSRTMALGSTQPLTEMSTRNLHGRTARKILQLHFRL
jgi:hypothetical protein